MQVHVCFVETFHMELLLERVMSRSWTNWVLSKFKKLLMVVTIWTCCCSLLALFRAPVEQRLTMSEIVQAKRLADDMSQMALVEPPASNSFAVGGYPKAPSSVVSSTSYLTDMIKERKAKSIISSTIEDTTEIGSNWDQMSTISVSYTCIICIYSTYHLHIIYISFAYPLHIICISFAYYLRYRNIIFLCLKNAAQIK